jgi:hypothetical protein
MDWVLAWKSCVVDLPPRVLAAERKPLVLEAAAATSWAMAALPAALAFTSGRTMSAWAATRPRLQASGWSIGAQPPAGHSSMMSACGTGRPGAAVRRGGGRGQ